MEKLYQNCRALFDVAFPDEDGAWSDALFSLALPSALRVIAEGEQVQAMLLAMPCELALQNGERQAARYLYAVATHPDFRGRGLATKLLQRVAAEGLPCFLRPMNASLFDFYRKAGLSPISPVLELAGESDPTKERFDALTVPAYLAAREVFLKPPYVVPSQDFLSLGFANGGAIGKENCFAAYYERREGEIFFKEWLGDTQYAAKAAYSLGAARYKLRTPSAPDSEGASPFGMAFGCPENLGFLIALD